MCRPLEQLSDHNRGQPPRSADDPTTAWRDTCTASLCERAAIERCRRFSTQKSSSPGHKGNQETPDTRRAAAQAAPQCLLTPVSAASGRSSPVAWGNARSGSVRSFHPRTKSSFLAHSELTKEAHSEGPQTLS